MYLGLKLGVAYDNYFHFRLLLAIQADISTCKIKGGGREANEMVARQSHLSSIRATKTGARSKLAVAGRADSEHLSSKEGLAQNLT